MDQNLDKKIEYKNKLISLLRENKLKIVIFFGLIILLAVILALFQINNKNKIVFRIRVISTVAASLIFLFLSYNMFIKPDQQDLFDENLLIFSDYDIYNSLYSDDISANDMIDNSKSYEYLISTMTYQDDLLILEE